MSCCGPHLLCGEGPGPREDVGCSSSGQGREEGDPLPQSLGIKHSPGRAVANCFSPRSYPQPWVQEEEEGSAFFLWENQEPKGAPRAHEAPKALRQRQQAKELLWLWAWEGLPQQPARRVPASALARPETSALTRSRLQGSHQLAAFLQPPYPSIGHTVCPKCSRGW